MKKEKITAAAVFLVVLFIVFVFGLFVGKKLSTGGSKEGTIKESALKNESPAAINSPDSGQGAGSQAQTPVSPGNMNFTSISNLPSGSSKTKPEPAKLESSSGGGAKKAESLKKNTVKKPVSKISYVRKPAYVRKPVVKKKFIPKTPSVKTVPGIYYTIQVAALGKYSQAKSLADKLNSMGFFAYILPLSVSGKNGKIVYQQVRVGKFSSESGAMAVENTIAKKFNVKPYIIKLG